MKTRIRFLSLLLAFLLVAPLFGGFAQATDGSGTGDGDSEQAQLETTLSNMAIDYVEKFVNTAFLYTTEDFETGTILTCDVTDIGGTGNVGEETTEPAETTGEEIQHFADVAEYQKLVRSTYEVERHNFVADYSVVSTDIYDDSAYIEVYAEVSFQYELDGETAVFGDFYEVWLTKIGDVWFISDVVSEEMATYGMTSEEFDCAAATAEFLEEFATGAEIQGVTETVVEVDDSATGYSARQVSNKTTYNKSNAVAYAYTYTTSTYTATSGNNRAFMNSSFRDYSAVGGNCQNFVSQCIWAGLYGNDSTSYINSSVYPMDNDGSDVWYGCQPGGSSSSSWTYIPSFLTYVTNSAATTDSSGLKASRYTVTGGTSFAGIPGAPYNLVGAALIVRNANQSRHAVLITGATSTSFASITYCANSPMRKNARLKDNFFCFQKRNMDVCIPHYFNEVNTCTGHTYQSYSTSIAPSGYGTVCTKCGYSSLSVCASMYKPFPVGTTKTITGSSVTQCYRLAIGITTPSGTTSWYEVTNAKQISRSYTFSEKGLYTITISVRDISDSNADSNTAQHIFKIRTY